MSDPVVYVVDDDEWIQRKLSLLLNSVGLEVQTFSGAQAFLSRSSLDCRPACLLLDVRMPGMSGLALQKELDRKGAEIPIIIMTGYGDVDTCKQAMKGGAFDFLEKPLNEQKLLDLVYFALEEDLKSVEAREEWRAIQERHHRLTQRESQVLDLVCLGLPNKQVAHKLSIGEGTVKVYRANVMEKMGANSLPELVRMAQRLGSSPSYPKTQPSRNPQQEFDSEAPTMDS